MFKKFKKDELRIRISCDRDSMGADAAEMVAEKLRDLLGKKEYVNIIFAAAPSQQEFLEHLKNEDGIEWQRVNAFHMDEYLGLNSYAPQLFGNFLKERIFEKLPFHKVFYINGNSNNESSRYADILKKSPPDIVCMGVGENSHIAFNDPHAANFEDPKLVKVVKLDLVCRQQQVNDGCFQYIEEVPTHALTLTIPALFMASYIFCIVPGANKAEAIFHTLYSDVNKKYPATILRRHRNAILFLDKESGAQLK